MINGIDHRAESGPPPLAGPAGSVQGLARSRWFWLVLLLWLQCCLALPWLNEPYGDGRQHYYFDNAKFLRHAIHSNFSPPGRFDVRLLTGTATWEFAPDGTATGLKFYARHPVLLPALFRGYAGLLGHGWWVPRSFMLLHLLPALAFLFLLLDDGLRRPWLAALLTAGYALLPLNALFGIQWKYENGVVMWTLAAWWLAVNAGRGARWRRALFVVAAVLPLTDWYAYPLTLFLLAFLFNRRQAAGYCGVWRGTLAAAVLGAAVNAGILAALMADSDGSSRALGWSGDGPLAMNVIAWLQQQWAFLSYNFTFAGRLLLVLGVLLALPVAGLLPAARRSALPWLAAGALASALLWQLTLAEAARYHHYYQWLAGLALVMLWGWLLGAGAARWPAVFRKCSLPLAGAVVLLAWLALMGTLHARQGIANFQFARTDDYAAVAQLPGRLLIFSDGRSGPVDWWQGPVITLLQDPLWRGDGSRGWVALVPDAGAPDPDHDLLALIANPDAQRDGISEMRRRFGPATFTRRAATSSFVFYAMQPEAGSDTSGTR